VIVVDNGSRDDSLALLMQAMSGDSRLQLIRNDRNLGFSAGCNVGVAASTAQCLLFLNPDCMLQTGALQRMLDVLQSDAAVGMVGGLLLDPDGTEQAGGRRAIPTPWLSFVRAFGLNRLSSRRPHLFSDFYLHKQRLPDAPIDVEAISGALMLVRRAAMDAVGLWDEGYFLHCEDLDWCMRFRQSGWRIRFVPDAPVIHDKAVCSRARPVFVEWHKHRGMIRFYRKFFRVHYPGGLFWLISIGVWLRFGLIVARLQARRVLHGWTTTRV
jgi:GT2 family glycosyltransferase